MSYTWVALGSHNFLVAWPKLWKFIVNCQSFCKLVNGVQVLLKQFEQLDVWDFCKSSNETFVVHALLLVDLSTPRPHRWRWPLSGRKLLNIYLTWALYVYLSLFIAGNRRQWKIISGAVLVSWYRSCHLVSLIGLLTCDSLHLFSLCLFICVLV